MARDVHTFVTACPVCVWGKPSHQATLGLLHPLTILQHPWSHIVVDVIIGLPPLDGDAVINHFS